MGSLWENVPESNVIVSVDWFALSCLLARPYDGRPLNLLPNWTFAELGGTAVWARRWFILDERGNKVATILSKPKSPILDERRCVVEIANEYLYEDNFLEVVDSVLSVYPMAVTGVNRVDLCGDFNMTKRMYYIYRLLQTGEAYLKGMKKGSDWNEWHARQKKAHQLTWGGIDSVFHWKWYYKYKELYEGGEGCSKPYIEEMWKREGLDVKHVWRLECSITSSNSLRIGDNDEKIKPFEWYLSRDAIYENLLRTKFVVREFTGKKDSRSDPRLNVFEYERDFMSKPMLHHQRESNSERESDCERRVICKMWKEFNEDDVQANYILRENIRQFLLASFERSINVIAVCKRFNLTESQVVNAIVPCET